MVDSSAKNLPERFNDYLNNVDNGVNVYVHTGFNSESFIDRLSVLAVNSNLEKDVVTAMKKNGNATVKFTKDKLVKTSEIVDSEHRYQNVSPGAKFVVYERFRDGIVTTNDLNSKNRRDKLSTFIVTVSLIVIFAVPLIFNFYMLFMGLFLLGVTGAIAWPQSERNHEVAIERKTGSRFLLPEEAETLLSFMQQALWTLNFKQNPNIEITQIPTTNNHLDEHFIQLVNSIAKETGNDYTLTVECIKEMNKYYQHVSNYDYHPVTRNRIYECNLEDDIFGFTNYEEFIMHSRKHKNCSQKPYNPTNPNVFKNNTKVTVGGNIQQRRENARKKYMEVKDSYGEKLLDVLYVIENNALFNVNFEPTEKFLTEYHMYRTDEIETLDIETFERYVSRLTISYKNAVNESEKLGYDALGVDAPKAKKAAGLARLAMDETNENEASAAWEAFDRVVKTLRVVIPERTLEAIENKTRKSVEY